MGRLFPTKKIRFVQRDEKYNVVKTWTSPEVDLTTKVVCKECNEGWMSNLEDRHAKPAMTDLILARDHISVSPSRAMAVARFAFKTAVVVDHMVKGEPFFEAGIRHHFAKSLTIPRNVRMWMTGYLPLVGGRLSANYHERSFEDGRSLEMYVCTYAVGHLMFQVVAANLIGLPSFEAQGFEHSAVPFWPTIPGGVVWPPAYAIKRSDFEPFSERWGKIRLIF